jgi:membrane fusion protein (multidrug efflux system)
MADSNTLERSPGGPGSAQAPNTTGRPSPPPDRYPSLRQRLFMGLGLVVVGAAVIWGLWYLFIGSHYVTTDDAYVDAKIAQITPQIDGTVAIVPVIDTQAVRKGDVLVVIDPADKKLALAQAEAHYTQALSRAKQYYANVDASLAQVAARKADVERAQVDFKRRQALESTGAISGDELTTARNALDTAKANLRAAEQQLIANRALVTSPHPEQNAEVLAAAAVRDKARLDMERTVIRAPIDGIVARSAVQIGQHVSEGAKLMSVVPVQEAFVDANFKESQLTDVRVGQLATLTSDLYGGGVTYHGHVIGIGGGTGSAMAIIPAQNATGNWIKIVQRLPVRIALDPRELEANPLRVGLSMTAKVDIREKDEGS